MLRHFSSLKVLSHQLVRITELEPKVIPSCFGSSLIHWISTGPVVWPALEPIHITLVLFIFSLDPEPFSQISIILKAL